MSWRAGWPYQGAQGSFAYSNGGKGYGQQYCLANLLLVLPTTRHSDHNAASLSLALVLTC